MITIGSTVRDKDGRFTGIVTEFSRYCVGKVKVSTWSTTLNKHKILFRDLNSLEEVTDPAEIGRVECADHPDFRQTVGGLILELALDTRDQAWFDEFFGNTPENV